MNAGKGDKPRSVNKQNYDSNFDKIKWNNMQTKDLKQTKSKKGKTTFYYK